MKNKLISVLLVCFICLTTTGYTVAEQGCQAYAHGICYDEPDYYDFVEPEPEPITLEQHWNIITTDLIKVLELEEGFRSKPYLGTEGHVHIGFGTKLHNAKGMNPDDFPIKIGRELAREWLHSEVADKDMRMAQGRHSKVYNSLNEDRQAMIMSMAYQIGTGGVRQFKRMWAALATGDYDTAAKEMLDSRWARQTPERAARHAQVMRGDTLAYVYSK